MAVRNEAKNIANLLDDILGQNYPTFLFEIVLIDDFSEDNTAEIINKYIVSHKNIKLIELQGKVFGKKEALSQGIKISKHNLIITTDADCRFGTEWLKTIVASYLSTRPKMLVAPVIFRPANYKKFSSIFNNLQSLEFLSLISSGAGAIGLERPVMCNGANLIFERAVYQEFNNPFSAHYVSGDDVLFMLKVKRKYPKQIKFIKSYKATAFTEAQPTFRDFVNQRIRWTSKSKVYKDLDLLLTSFTVLTTNLLLFVLLILSFFMPELWQIFLFVFIIKSIPDFILLFLTSKFFRIQKLLIYFLPLQFLYFFYIVFIGIIGNFSQFSWKNRNF